LLDSSAHGHRVNHFCSSKDDRENVHYGGNVLVLISPYISFLFIAPPYIFPLLCSAEDLSTSIKYKKQPTKKCTTQSNGQIFTCGPGTLALLADPRGHLPISVNYSFENFLSKRKLDLWWWSSIVPTCNTEFVNFQTLFKL